MDITWDGFINKYVQFCQFHQHPLCGRQCLIAVHASPRTRITTCCPTLTRLWCMLGCWNSDYDRGGDHRECSDWGLGGSLCQRTRGQALPVDPSSHVRFGFPPLGGTLSCRPPRRLHGPPHHILASISAEGATQDGVVPPHLCSTPSHLVPPSAERSLSHKASCLFRQVTPTSMTFGGYSCSLEYR